MDIASADLVLLCICMTLVSLFPNPSFSSPPSPKQTRKKRRQQRTPSSGSKADHEPPRRAHARLHPLSLSLSQRPPRQRPIRTFLVHRHRSASRDFRDIHELFRARTGVGVEEEEERVLGAEPGLRGQTSVARGASSSEEEEGEEAEERRGRARAGCLVWLEEGEEGERGTEWSDIAREYRFGAIYT
ncbi:hypothetical protein DXG01_008803 [Tephrocybe rancida]|nr:hypothetical protein DXG01_008803 [Tephrocybe rancida]